MLLLLSSRWSGGDLSECDGGLVFEFGVGAGADLESSESLVGNVESGGEDADRDPEPLPFEAEVASDGVVGGGVENVARQT